MRTSSVSCSANPGNRTSRPSQNESDRRYSRTSANRTDRNATLLARQDAKAESARQLEVRTPETTPEKDGARPHAASSRHAKDVVAKTHMRFLRRYVRHAFPRLAPSSRNSRQRDTKNRFRTAAQFNVDDCISRITRLHPFPENEEKNLRTAERAEFSFQKSGSPSPDEESGQARASPADKSRASADRREGSSCAAAIASRKRTLSASSSISETCWQKQESQRFPLASTIFKPLSSNRKPPHRTSTPKPIPFCS